MTNSPNQKPVEACIWYGDNPMGIMDLKRHADPRARFLVEVTGSTKKPKLTGRLLVENSRGEEVECQIGHVVVLDDDGFPFVVSMETFKEKYEYD